MPDELREALRDARRAVVPPAATSSATDGGFKAPADYPRRALVAGQHARPADARRLVAGRGPAHARTRSGSCSDERAAQADATSAASARARCSRRCARRPAAGSATAPRTRRSPRTLRSPSMRFLARTPSQRDGGADGGRARRRCEQANLPGTIDAASQLAPQARRSAGAVVARRALRSARARAAPPSAGARGARRDGAAGPRGRARSRAPPIALQLHRDFTLRATRRGSCPTSRALGVSHVYCSPYLARAPRQHARLRHRRPQRAQSRDRHARGLRALRRRAARARHGPDASTSCPTTWACSAPTTRGGWTCSRTARPRPTPSSSTSTGSRPSRAPRASVLLPVLGDHYGVVLERGELRARLRGRDRRFALRYYEHRLPIDPREYPRILAARRARARRRRRDALAPRAVAARIADAFARLPRARRAATERALDERDARQGSAQGAARRARAREHARSRAAIERAVAALNGRPAIRELRRAARAARGAGLPPRLLARRAGRDQLPALLRHQRPRGAAHGERRGVRGDAPPRARSWCRTARSTALRIDHPDGLYDPQRLLQRCSARTRRPCRRKRPRALRAWSRRSSRRYENLPEDWAVHGTTGYRFANVVNGLFVDPRAEARIDAHLRSVHRRRRRPSSEIALRRASALILRTRARERAHRARPAASRASRAPTATRATSRFTTLRDGARRSDRRLFPVYRTYIDDDVHPRGPALHRVGRRARRAPQPRRRRRACSTSSATRSPASCRRARRRCGAPMRFFARVPAVHRAGDGEGRRGHAFYRYNRLAVAERRRRRSRRVRHSRPRVPPRERAPREALAAHDARDLDARQQALRGRARAHRRALRDGRRLAPAAAPLEPPERGSKTRRATARRRRRATTSTCSTRRCSAASRRRASTASDARELSRAHPGVHAEGGARGEGAHELGQP